MMTPAQFRAIYDSHQAYWAQRSEEMGKLHQLYSNKCGEQSVPRTFRMVETTTGALFLRAPGVVGIPGIYGSGDAELAAACGNEILRKNTESLEFAAKAGLLFPWAYLTVSPMVANNPMDRVKIQAAHPWRVVRDFDAPDWRSSRWVGLVSQIPLLEALGRYDRTEEDWLPHDRENYLPSKDTSLVPNGSKYVTVVEVYLPKEGRQVVWSPNLRGAEEWVQEGFQVQVGGRVDASGEDGAEGQEEPVMEKVDGLLYSASGTPLVPIIPLIFNPDPIDSGVGLSLIEINVNQLNALNKVSSVEYQMMARTRRVYTTHPEVLDPQNRAILEGDQDSAVVVLGGDRSIRASEALTPLPIQSVPADVPRYKEALELGLEEASMMPSFTMGAASKATATEVTQLATYADTKLGKMAAILAKAVADAAEVAVAMLRVMLGDDVESIALPKPFGPRMLSAKDLQGDWSFTMVDEASTPTSIARQRQELERLLPTLQNLGVPPEVLVKHLVKAFGLPEELANIPAPPQPQPQPQPSTDPLSGIL